MKSYFCIWQDRIILFSTNLSSSDKRTNYLKFVQLFYWSQILFFKDTNRKIGTTFFVDYCVWVLVPNSQYKTCTAPFVCVAHISSEFTCFFYVVVGTIFGTNDVNELRYSYLSVSIFTIFEMMTIILFVSYNKYLIFRFRAKQSPTSV